MNMINASSNHKESLKEGELIRIMRILGHKIELGKLIEGKMSRIK